MTQRGISFFNLMTNKNQKTYSIGVDIGGTKMSAILFDGNNILEEFTLATPKDTLDHFWVMLQALLKPLFEKADELKIKISGIGIGLAGMIDYKTGKMLDSPNIKILNGIKVAELFKEKIDLPIKIDNDANCFARAEAVMGAGKKYNSVYGLIIGTGIGGGWYIDKKIYQTEDGGSGEPGTMIVDFHNGKTLEEKFHEITENNPENLAEKAYYGDVAAQDIFINLGTILGFSLANIVNTISPEIIVIGGGVSESDDLFLNHTKKIMKSKIGSPLAAKKIKLVRAKLGKMAGAMGAALMIE